MAVNSRQDLTESSSRFLGLPIEIQVLIAEHVDRFEDLRSLCLAFPHLNHHVTKNWNKLNYVNVSHV